MKKREVFLLGLWLTICLLCASVSLAQIKSATITGSVADSAGARVPGAAVSVVNEETGVATDAVANDSGEYTVPFLAPGRYSVKISVTGFAAYTQSGVELATAQTSRVDAELQAGGIGESVEVSSATQLQTETSDVKNVIGEQIIQAVPNISHNPLAYATLQPGVVPRAGFNSTQNAASFGVGTQARQQYSAISVNGGAAFTNDIQLDGVSAQGAAYNEISVIPNQEGLQEVRTLVNNYTAEYGRGQGVITLTTKSGTNGFHGSVYEYVRNEAFNANTFGNNAQGVSAAGLPRNPRPAFKSHLFGGTVGGPIYLPRFGEGGSAFFRGQDRAFFFFSYEGRKRRQGVDSILTVPTERERIGDFSQTYANVGGRAQQAQIYDPFTATPIFNSAGTLLYYQRNQVPNGQLNLYTRPANSSRPGTPGVDPFAARLFSFYPLPNQPALPDASCVAAGLPATCLNRNNYNLRVLRDYSRNSFNSRVDFRAGSHSFYTTFGVAQGTVNTPSSYGEGNPFSRNYGIARLIQDKNPYASVGDTIILSPTLVLDVRYAFNRINANGFTPPANGLSDDQFGIPASLQAINQLPGVPLDTYGDFTPFAPLNDQRSFHKENNQTNHSVVASLNKSYGRFNFKFGGEGRVYLSNYLDPEQSFGLTALIDGNRPFVNADGFFANAAGTPAGVTLFNSAGALQGGGRLEIAAGRNIRIALAQKYFALYQQNDWKVTDSLTLNLGLRWDLQPGPTERFNRVASFDTEGTNPFGSRGAFAFAGTDGYARNLYRTRYKDFGPRVGFAYKAKGPSFIGEFVARGGYGISYLPTNTGYFDGPYSYGADAFTTFAISRPFGAAPAGVVVGPYYETTTVSAPRGTTGISSAPIYGIGNPKFDYQNYQNGSVQQWNFFLEKRLGNDFVVQAGYSASRGTHLPVAAIQLNNAQLLPQSVLDTYRAAYIASNETFNPGNQTRVCNPLQTLQTCNPANPAAASGQLIPFSGSAGQRTLTLIQSQLPYPLFGDLGVSRTFGTSNYHSFVTQVTRRLARGLQFNANYVFSKATDNAQNQAQGNGFAETGAGFVGGTSAIGGGGGLDFRNYANNKKLSLTDVPHRFVSSFFYELPFGQNQFLDVRNPVLRSLVGGFRLGGIVNVQSGVPLLITGGSGSFNGRPDRVPGVPVEVPKELQRFYNGLTTVTLPSGRLYTPPANTYLKYNPDAFSGRTVTTPNGSIITDIYWFGNAALSYDDIRAPSYNNVNLTLERTFRLGESLALDFAAQASNVFNKAQFQANSFGGGLNVGGTVVAGNATDIDTNLRLNQTTGQVSNNSSNFGTRNLNTFDPRQIEFVFRFRF